MVVDERLPLLGAEDHRMDVAAWLQRLGLERYVPAFRDNDVDAEVLLRLTAEDLRELGVASMGIAVAYWMRSPH
jgi:SAM (Sterile alpha motif) domain-containing protein